MRIDLYTKTILTIVYQLGIEPTVQLPAVRI